VGSLLDECFDHEAGLADVYGRARRAGPVPSSQRLGAWCSCLSWCPRRRT